MNALEVKNLTKIYPTFTLDNVSFSVREGRIVGLIGRNGAGKSTTIKSVLKLISSSGEVKIFGTDVNCDEKNAKKLVGYVGGGFRYYRLKTLDKIKNAYKNFFPEWNEDAYRAYALKFNLDGNKLVKDLSEGMKVKFSMALALSHGAKLLIMDEPTSGLDPLSREEFCDTVLDLVKNEGISVLFSTHVTSDLMSIADDIVYIADGKILADCPLNDLLSKYKLVRFSDVSKAKNYPVIGLKTVKDGCEGLISSDKVTDELSCEQPTIDRIMIHLEKDKEKRNA